MSAKIGAEKAVIGPWRFVVVFGVVSLLVDFVPAGRRATAYGLFAAVIRVATLAGGGIADALYAYSISLLIVATVALQAAALVLLVLTRSATASRRRAGA